MADPSTSFQLSEQTWEDAETTFDSADYVILPCGSTEQHSTHLPLSVDTIRAEELTKDLCRAAPEYDLDLVMLPPLPYGESEHHMHFPGTITISADTYQQFVEDIGRSVAEHGGQRFAVVNCHGGNREPHKLALKRVQRETDLETHYVHWTDFARDRLESRFGEEWGHAGEYETSVIEHYRPDTVRQEKKTPQTRKARFETRVLSYFDDITKEGGIGDPTRSDPEFAAEVIDATTDDILETLQDECN